MNLHAAVRGAITTVNPDVTAIVKRSAGSTTLPDGGRVPAFTTIADVQVQVQALSYDELAHLDSLGIQGVRRAVYLFGSVMGVVRVDQKGGDLLVFPAGTLPEGNVWLAAHVLEQWPGWCKAAITLQNGS